MKFPSEIFGFELNERQSSEIPRASSPLALTYSAMGDKKDKILFNGV